MKNLLKKAVIFAVAGIMALSVEAQEEKGVQFTVSGDFVSSYVWRGIYQGGAASFQPTFRLPIFGGEDKEITVISIMGIRIQTIILKQVYLMLYLVKSFL